MLRPCASTNMTGSPHTIGFPHISVSCVPSCTRSHRDKWPGRSSDRGILRSRFSNVHTRMNGRSDRSTSRRHARSPQPERSGCTRLRRPDQSTLRPAATSHVSCGSGSSGEAPAGLCPGDAYRGNRSPLCPARDGTSAAARQARFR